jgi:lipoate-protein ligase A
MAADETLLEAAVAGTASFRLYGWSQATLSLGYFQAAAPCRADPLLAPLPWVRRPSGGETLVHHHELTYALALPAGPPWQRRGESWVRRMHRLLAETLATQGISVRCCRDGEEKRLGDVLCFLHQTPCDLLLGGAKVAGSAQRKRRGALLQHGAVLLAQSPHAPALPGLRELAGLDPAARDTLGAALITALARDTGWELAPSDWTGAERRRIDGLTVARYRDPAWNGKR